MICVSIGYVTVDECISIIKTSKMAEVRLDLIKDSTSNIKKIFSCSKNLIATYRANELINDDDDRAAFLIESMNAGAEYVDVELDSSDIFKIRVMEEAKNKGKKVIVSYHNCEQTPSKKELFNILKNCIMPLGKNKLSPDVLKIACLSQSQNDNARLL
ncbi:MAG: type I 3-dehydroquinate dehydratase, partial [bacterium]